jgi:hypothetical protein
MFTRPPFFLTAALLGATLVAICVVITPITDPPEYAAEMWWARVAPFSYAVHTLRTAPAFVALDPASEASTLFDNRSRAWRGVVHSRGADSIFAHLYATGGPATRLYALTGLYWLHARSLPAALAQAQRDTGRVRIWRSSCHCPRLVPLARMASADSLRVLAIELSVEAVLPN